MKLAPLFLLSLVLTGCSSKWLPWPARPLKLDPLELPITKEVLNNGLTVIVIENRKLPLFSLFSFVKVGARHEIPGITGAGHYLEHMMFKGSRHYPEGEFEKIIVGNGGSHNAYTTKDLTVYHESLPIHALDTVLDLEADRLFHLSLESRSFERERAVILEERKYRTENSPRGQLFQATMAAAYRQTPYAHPTIGSIPDIKSVSLAAIQQHFATFYDPANIVVVLSGDFNTPGVMKKIRNKFAQVPSTQKFAPIKNQRDTADHYKFQKKWPQNIELQGNSPLPMFMAAYPSFPKGHAQSSALDILSSILGGGASSHFAQKYIHSTRPHLSNFYAFNYDMQRSGLLLFGGQLLPHQRLDKFRNQLRRDLKRSCSVAITAREVEKVKNQYLANYFGSFETNRGLATLIGNSEVYHGDPLYFKQQLQHYLDITDKEVRDTCQEVVENNSPVIVSMWRKQHKKR